MKTYTIQTAGFSKGYTVMPYENNHIIIAMPTVHANVRNLC